MTKVEIDMMNKLGLTEDGFKPKSEDVTISDLVELVGVLTDIVIGGGEDD